MVIDISINMSPFEYFLLRFFDRNPSDLYVSIYFHLLCYLSINRFDIFCLPFLRSLNQKQNLQITANLPNCKSVFIHLMELLLEKDTFLMAFERLFRSFDKIPATIIPFFNKCFRIALKNQILINKFDIMLSIISRITENSLCAYDFFFLALTADSSLIQKYIQNKKDTILFQINPKFQKMPISFLKFLILTHIKCRLPEQIIWQFFQNSPSLTFELINCYSEKSLYDIWKQLITQVQNYSTFQDIHFNIYYFFLLSSIKHPKLIPLFKTIKLISYIKDLIFLKDQSNFILTDQKTELLLLCLLFSRVNDSISNEFISINNYQKILTLIISGKGQYESFINYFLWILNPTDEFPMKEIVFPCSKEIFLIIPPPSFTFSSEIAPNLLAIFIKIGISDHFNEPSFEKLINVINKIYELGKNPSNLLLGIADTSILTSLIPYAMKSEKYFNLLTSALSISCIFPVFSNIYSLIFHDDQKLLNFFISVSSTAPLVNDFLRIDTKHKLNFSCMNGTIAMWVRFLNKPSQIMKIRFNSNTKVYIKKEENTFVLEVNKGGSRFIPMNDDICGWYFIIIELKPKSIAMSVNLAQVKIDYSFGQSANISIGKRSSNFDLQSFHFFRSELSNSNIFHLFSLGPNYKPNFVDNFLSLKYESFFVQKNNFISTLYLQWIANFHNKNLNLIPPVIDTPNSENIFSKNYEFGISPPYGQFYSNQRIQSNDKKSEILEKRFYFESFFNSLDAHGGISLLIHFLTEIILKKKELHFLAFNLFNVLVNKFPFIHYYFEENNVYRLIGQILWKSSPDAKSIFNCAMTVHKKSDSCIITNVDVVKYWLFGPSLFYFEFYDLIMTILTSLDGQFADDNLVMLEKADCFKSLIKSISNSAGHSERFLSVLMALALKITNQNNAQKHAEIIIKYLLVYHFKTPKNDKNKTDYKIVDVDDLNERKERINENKNDENKINDIDNSNESKERIDENKNNGENQINEKNDEIKGKSINDKKLNDKIIENEDDENEINVSTNDELNNENIDNDNKNKEIVDEKTNSDNKINSNESNRTVSLIHLLGQILFNYGNKITVSLKLLLPMFLNSSTPVLNSLYDLMLKYLKTSDHTDLIITLSKSFNNPEFSDYVYSYTTSFIFKANEHSYQQFYYITIPILYLLTQEHKEEQMIAIFSAAATILDQFNQFPSFIFDHIYRFLYKIKTMKLMSYFFGHDVNSISIQITPFCHFLLKLLICSLFNSKSSEYVKSFIRAFFALDRGDFSIFVVSYLLDRLLDFDYENCQQNVQHLTSISCDLFLNISFILRDRKVNPPPYIPFFIQNSCNFIDFFNNNEIMNCFLFLLNEISYNSSTIALSIVSIVSNCKTIQNLQNYKEIVYMLESPMMILNSKQKKIAFKVDLTKFLNFIQKVDENDINRFLTIYCDSVLNQTLNAESIFAEQEENDDILQKWREIFLSLNFPGSQIYSNCPTKYKVDESTIKYQIRRVLLPLNPSLDNQYLDYWETKYSKEEKKPKIRLTIKDVFEDLNYSHTDDILFTSESSLLHGTSIIPGFFVVTKKTIKFFSERKKKFLFFNVNKIHSIRLIDYQHQPIGIFIDEKDINTNYISNSTMFAFKSKSIRIDFIMNIEKNFEIKIIHQIDNSQLNTITLNWSNGRITNMEYLLYLNFLSGRTWSDLTRYPIFPWVCLDFSKSEPIMRDLKFPFFAQTEEQKKSCIKYYKMTQEVPDEAPHYYSNYISNVGSALYFLVRIEPFTTEEIEYQGGSLDSPDRSFQSFSIAADVMTHPGEKSTLELVPEVYFMPDFLININNIKFPKSPLNGDEIGDVKLPSSWFDSNLSPFKFIRKMRKILESNEVSEFLNEWIDLIWGIRRSGAAAEERFNVFASIIYEFDQSRYCKDQKLMNAFSSLMHNCGQAPLQLFYDFHPKRQIEVSKKLKISMSGKIENKRPRIEDLIGLGFDIKKRDKNSNTESLLNKSVIFTCPDFGDSFVRIGVENSSISVEKIDFFSGKSSKSSVFFSNEIEPILISGSQNSTDNEMAEFGGFQFCSAKLFLSSSSSSSSSSFMMTKKIGFITAHKIPVINYWHFLTDKCQMLHVCSLRGHLSPVTSIALNENGSTCFAGHEDGSISSFRLSPNLFLRTFKCKKKIPVTKVAVLNDNSCLFVVQNTEKKLNKSIRGTSFISLFEINGSIIAEVEIGIRVVDCVLTSFNNGVQTNFAFVLTESSKILALSMNSLKIKAVVDPGQESLVSISLWNSAVLVALTSTNSLISWNLFDLTKNAKRK